MATTMRGAAGLVVVLACVCGAAQADTTLYAYDTGDDKLGLVDTAGPTLLWAGPDHAPSFIAEIEYGGGVIYGSDTFNVGKLHLMSPATGAIYDTLTMTLPAQGDAITALEFIGGVLYGGLTTAMEGNAETYLSTVNLTTGQVTVIGATGVGTPLGGLAYDGSTLYGISAGGSVAELFTIDLGTGGANSVGLVTLEGETFGATALEFGQDGVLYALPNTRSPLVGHLLSVDPQTALATDLGAIDPGSYEFNYPVALTSIPEPSTVALVIIGAAGLMGRRRRKSR